MASNTQNRWRVTDGIASSLMVVGALLQSGCDRVSTSQATVTDAVDHELEAPIIEFPTTALDLGEVPANFEEPAKANFVFRNVGGSPLRIEEVSNDCLCAVAEVDPAVVLPGTEGVVRLNLRRESPRPSAATITLRSNDPIYPETQLSIKWHVVGPVEFEPVFLDLGNIVPTGSKTQSVRLIHRFGKNEPQASGIAKIDCEPADSLAAEVESHTATSETQENFEILLTLKAGAVPGEHRGRIRSPVTSGGGPQVSLPVRWYVRPTIEASPSELYLGSGRAGETLEKAVVVSSEASAGDLEVSTVKIRPDDGTLSVVETSTSKCAIILTTKTRLTGPTGARRWDVVVKCNRPIEQSVTIATSAYVSSSSEASAAPE